MWFITYTILKFCSNLYHSDHLPPKLTYQGQGPLNRMLQSKSCPIIYQLGKGIKILEKKSIKKFYILTGNLFIIYKEAICGYFWPKIALAGWTLGDINEDYFEYVPTETKLLTFNYVVYKTESRFFCFNTYPNLIY